MAPILPSTELRCNIVVAADLRCQSEGLTAIQESMPTLMCAMLSTLQMARKEYTGLYLQLEELTITGEQSDGNWHVGLDCIPEEWASLTRLTKLELRGHSLLNVSC